MHVARIQVRNLATIDQVHLDFDPGFHVLTGETGAGKSILVDALKLISGGRADTSAIQIGRAHV